MNPPNRKSPPESKGASQFKRPAAGAQPFKAAAVQSKNALNAQSVKRPVAPPVYSPQAKPKVMQTKASGARQSQPSNAHLQPAAPHAKHHEPKVLQLKVLQLKQTPHAEAKARPASSVPKQGVAPLNARPAQGYAPARQVIQRSSSSSAAADYRDDPGEGAGKAWPASKADRPYNDFDAKYPGACSAFRDFSGEQRKALIAYNKKKNGGKLKSDAGNDPHQDLTEDTGAATSVEVDHIIPKSKGGCNHFLNARLISWELNNALERFKDTSALVTPKK
jgi:hypothetical protein